MEPLATHHTKRTLHADSSLARQVVSDPIVRLELQKSRISVAENKGDLGRFVLAEGMIAPHPMYLCKRQSFVLVNCSRSSVAALNAGVIAPQAGIQEVHIGKEHSGPGLQRLFHTVRGAQSAWKQQGDETETVHTSGRESVSTFISTLFPLRDLLLTAVDLSARIDS